jgi:hypothetical protein
MTAISNSSIVGFGPRAFFNEISGLSALFLGVFSYKMAVFTVEKVKNRKKHGKKASFR